jgi:AraC-like DNA-binding protein
LVESLWYFRGEFPHQRERVLPTGNLQLLVNLYEDELRSYYGAGYVDLQRSAGAALCGAHARHFGIDTAEQRAIVGVSFKPGGAFPFFAAPADATSEMHVGLDALWGREGALLRERLLETRRPEQTLATLEAVLLARAVRPLEQDPAVVFAVDAFERGVPVATVVDGLGCTPRHFIQRFSAAVGLTPKRFARVRRFQRVLASLRLGQRVDWAQVALACGYFDQAHLIRDFRDFSGESPTAYQPRSSEERNHVPLCD